MTIATLAEYEAFLKDHPGIDTVQVFFTNLTGVPRGKNMRLHELRSVFENGRYLPGTMLALDITGEDVEKTGLVWEDGDADRLGKPVAGTLLPMPWMGLQQAQLMLSVYELDGSPCVYDPRHVLAAVIEKFKPLGIKPVVACELEFFLLDQERDPLGRLQPPQSPLSGYRSWDIQAYGVRELDDASAFLRDLYAACAVQGIPAETAISEYAAGQLEITLRHRNDALQAADETVLYKRLVKGVALEHGCEATFMAKPFADRSGNGMHLHISLEDEKGNNLFASDTPEGTPLLRQAIAGMMTMLPESMAIFAPNANSYRRFKTNSYAPIAATWGVNNRTVALRVPAGPAPSRHIEHRMSGADANPYLALAALLSAVHLGITEKMDPGAPVTGDGYSAKQKPATPLPRNWYNAMDLFDNGAYIRSYLGADFSRVYSAVKRTEQDRFYAQVTELDYAWYLRNA